MLTRDDTNIDFDWAYNSPAAGINADHFSIRWTRTFSNWPAGTYVFHVLQDDGARLWIDDTLILSEWHVGHEEHTVQRAECGKPFHSPGGLRDRWMGTRGALDCPAHV
ncbi:MAG: hypothetical protein IPO15_02780 [Anaerolineae bacterium]|nr:hypothetical protein [Anaerolineae bacterium]